MQNPKVFNKNDELRKTEFIFLTIGIPTSLLPCHLRLHFAIDISAIYQCATFSTDTIGSDNGLSPGRRQAIIWTNIVW